MLTPIVYVRADGYVPQSMAHGHIAPELFVIDVVAGLHFGIQARILRERQQVLAADINAGVAGRKLAAEFLRQRIADLQVFRRVYAPFSRKRVDGCLLLAAPRHDTRGWVLLVPGPVQWSSTTRWVMLKER